MDHRTLDPPADPYRAAQAYLSQALRVLVTAGMVLIGAGLVGCATVEAPPPEPIPVAATPPPPCGQRLAVLQQFEQRFAEVPAHLGLTYAGTLLEILVSPDGNWSAFQTFPNGMTCFVSSGTEWQSINVGRGS